LEKTLRLERSWKWFLNTKFSDQYSV
jgi:hypothetical protein